MSVKPLRIGVIAPPWVPIPPPAYGGTELVIDLLCEGLQKAGHEVTLFTTADSTCPVPKESLFATSDVQRMGSAVLELRHVAAAYDVLATMDIVHDHTLAGLFYSERLPDLPVVATNHGPFNADLADIYRRVADRIPVIAISQDQASRAPKDLPIAAVIHHGLDLSRYRFGTEPDDYILFLGRMAAEKGVDAAVRVAREANLPLLIAAKMREPAERAFFRRSVEPFLDARIRYVGEVDFETKVELLSKARALINPIGWPEPFGLVMAEALACGTPVVGYGNGAAPEIVENGVSGLLVDDEAGLLAALGRVEELDRSACRQRASDRFTAARMVADHIALYKRVLADRGNADDIDQVDRSPERDEIVLLAG